MYKKYSFLIVNILLTSLCKGKKCSIEELFFIKIVLSTSKKELYPIVVLLISNGLEFKKIVIEES